MAEAKDSSPELHYWGGVASRGHYYGYVLAYNGLTGSVTLKNEGIAYPGTPDFAAYEHKSVLGQLPYMVDGEIKIGQSGAILRYLVKKFDLYAGRSDSEYAHSEQLIETSADIHSMLSGAHYAGDRTAAMDALFGEGGKVGKVLGAFEALIDGKDFIAGGASPTPGDLAFSAALNLLVRLEAEVLTGFPGLKAMYDKVMANDGIKAYDASCPYPYFKRQSD